MNTTNNKTYLYLLITIFLFMSLALPKNAGHPPDMHDFADWAKAIFTNGIGNIYSFPSVNYNPGYLYVLKIFGLIQGSIEKIDKNIVYLRLLTLVFDFTAVYALIKYFKKIDVPQINALFVLFNFAYLYNTLIWGQVDGIHTCFVFLAFIAGFYNRPSFSIVFYVIALNIKLQAIVFLPPLILLIAPSFFANRKELRKGILYCILAELIIISPFILNNSVYKIIDVNIHSVGYFPYASLNAFNVWHLLLLPQNDPLSTRDNLKFLFIHYKQWGIIMFMLSSAIVLIPLMLVSIKKIKLKEVFNKEFHCIITLSTCLIAIVFFYFNTQMHERYLHSAIIFAGVYAIMNKDYFFYIVLSAAYLLNLEKALHYFNTLNYNTFIFNTQFIASLFLICIVWGMYKLYVLYKPYIHLLKRQNKLTQYL